MPITNEQVIDSLIAFYKNRGADLSYLLVDPVFSSMSIQNKVEAIKRHAAELHQGINSNWTTENRGNIISNVIGGAVSGSLMGFSGGKAGLGMFQQPLASTMARNKVLATLAATGAVAGAIAGGVTSYLNQKEEQDTRKELKKAFGNLAQNPTDNAAVGIFPLTHQYEREHALRHGLVHRITRGIEAGFSKLESTAFPNQAREAYNLHLAQEEYDRAHGKSSS